MIFILNSVLAFGLLGSSSRLAEHDPVFTLLFMIWPLLLLAFYGTVEGLAASATPTQCCIWHFLASVTFGVRPWFSWLIFCPVSDASLSTSKSGPLIVPLCYDFLCLFLNPSASVIPGQIFSHCIAFPGSFLPVGDFLETF